MMRVEWANWWGDSRKRKGQKITWESNKQTNCDAWETGQRRRNGPSTKKIMVMMLAGSNNMNACTLKHKTKSKTRKKKECLPLKSRRKSDCPLCNWFALRPAAAFQWARTIDCDPKNRNCRHRNCWTVAATALRTNRSMKKTWCQLRMRCYLGCIRIIRGGSRRNKKHKSVEGEQ